MELLHPVAKVIKASRSVKDPSKQIITFGLEYWRAIHGEFMTHRALSKNASSSRAIPFSANEKIITDNLAGPVFWGLNEPGMVAQKEANAEVIEQAKKVWKRGANLSVAIAKRLHNLGLHKQIVNRVMEPFSPIKVIATGTEWNNFFWLRDHPDAQPEIQALAKSMYSALQNAEFQELKEGEWHLPYIDLIDGKYFSEGTEVSLEDARIISASCCAQTSYRKSDTSIDKAKMVYNRLITSQPVHASPTEHQARLISDDEVEEVLDVLYDSVTLSGHLKYLNFPEGITHIGNGGSLWSGNLKNFIQFRQLIPNNVKAG